MFEQLKASVLYIARAEVFIRRHKSWGSYRLILKKKGLATILVANPFYMTKPTSIIPFIWLFYLLSFQTYWHQSLILSLALRSH